MTTREQLQALIRAEIDRQRPVAVARRTLELLVEAAIRRLDAPPGYQVVDRDGRPRTRTVAGEVQPLTLGDLVDELRRQHPTLFLPPVSPGPAPAAAPAARDWIVVDPAPRPSVASPAPPDRTARLRDALQDLGARLRRPPREPASPEAAPIPVPPPPPGEGLKPGLARPQPVLGRTSTRRPLYAALGALVLLGGAYAALRSPGPADRAAVAQAPAPATRPAEAKPPARTDEAKTGDKTGDPKPSDARSAEARPGEARSEAKSEARSGAKREPGETGAVEGPIAGVAEVVDTATLRLGGRTLRLSGVEAARGAQASDLSGYLAGRPVNCQPNPGRSAWICTVDGHDLSEVVLYNGGGRATPEATPDLVDAERHARTARLGIWARP